MIQFQSNLSYYINLTSQNQASNSLMLQILEYLTTQDATRLGFYALLENNHIYDTTSIKKNLLDTYSTLKSNIQHQQDSISSDQLHDLSLTRNLWQIDNSSLARPI